MEKLKTLVINFFAGPDAGKSTLAAELYVSLKKQGVNCELVREYAKDKTWIGDGYTLGIQPYISAKQYYRQCAVDGKVDIMITDSPLPLGLVYPGRGSTPTFRAWVMEAFREFDNLSFFVERCPVREYNPTGRNQDYEEALEVDQRIWELLKEEGIEALALAEGDPHRLYRLEAKVSWALLHRDQPALSMLHYRGVLS